MFKPAVENAEKTNSSTASHACDGIHSAVHEAWSPRPQSSESNMSQNPATPTKSVDFSTPIASGYPVGDAPNSNYQNAKGNPGSDIQSTAITGTDSRLEGMQSNGGLDQRMQPDDGFNQRQNYSGKQTSFDGSQLKQQPVPGQMYQIKAGDNLWNIASRGQSGDATSQSNADTAKFSSQIVDANNLSHPNMIKPGEQIKIPPRS